MSWIIGVKVAVGVITDPNRRVLITQRPLSASHGGLWEFPGGKLEDNEAADSALIRELKEELGIDVTEYRFLGEIQHHYPTLSVHLIIFQVTQWIGTPLCLEGQLQMLWAFPEDIPKDNFPAANRGIFDMLL